jgi:hypothetical protein
LLPQFDAAFGGIAKVSDRRGGFTLTMVAGDVKFVKINQKIAQF